MFNYRTDESRQDDDSVHFESWDGDNMGDDNFDFPTYSSDTEDLGTLVRPPRQVRTMLEFRLKSKINLLHFRVLILIHMHLYGSCVKTILYVKQFPMTFLCLRSFFSDC